MKIEHFLPDTECRFEKLLLVLLQAEAEIQEDAVLPGQKVVLIDDLLATGGEDSWPHPEESDWLTRCHVTHAPPAWTPELNVCCVVLQELCTQPAS